MSWTSSLYVCVSNAMRGLIFLRASSYSEARLRPLLYGEADKCRRRFRRRDILDLIGSGADSGGDKKLFGQIVDNLLWHDPYSLLANYQSCVDCRDQVSALWTNQQARTCKSIANVPLIGKFSSDRSVGEYCDHICHAKSVHV